MCKYLESTTQQPWSVLRPHSLSPTGNVYTHLFDGNLLNVYLEKCLFKYLLSETSRVLWKSQVRAFNYMLLKI